MDFLSKLAHWQICFYGQSFALWTDYHKDLDKLKDLLSSSLARLSGELPQIAMLCGVIFFSIIDIFEYNF